MKINCWSVDQRINRQPSFQRTKNHVPSSGNLLIFFIGGCQRFTIFVQNLHIFWNINQFDESQIKNLKLYVFCGSSFSAVSFHFHLILLQIFPYNFASMLNKEKWEGGNLLYFFGFRFASLLTKKGMAYPNTGAWLSNRCHSLRGFYKWSVQSTDKGSVVDPESSNYSRFTTLDKEKEDGVLNK